MDQQEVNALFESQKQFFSKGRTLSLDYRRDLLLRLKKAIEINEDKIHEALKKDLNKSKFESFLSETQFSIIEIESTLKKLKKWMSPKRVKSPLLQWPVKSYIQPEPLGTVLIIAPWNYPFQLLFSPLIGAIAAGNTAILKPSEVSPNVSKVSADIISEYFEPHEIGVVEGAIDETNWLLDLPFDHIFYTGNGFVARIIMEKAAKHLTPVTLELGGKSPCFVFGKTDMDLTAKRIVWGKFFNSGQTCVAPDYLLVEKGKKEVLVEGMKKYLSEFYGSNIKGSPDYGRIINERHFDRLEGLIEKDKVLIGGNVDKSQKYIEPTVLDGNESMPVMKEEIFGPLLPVLEFEDLGHAIDFVRARPKPLATYIFSQDYLVEKQILQRVSTGGVCINDTLVHLSTEHLPFGGVGESGMGRYHGHFSFETFSHMKSIMKRSFWFDLAVRYPPYLGKLPLIRRIINWLA